MSPLPHAFTSVTQDDIQQTNGLGKSFNGIAAEHGVRLGIRRGSIHARIGPNDAGKTTRHNTPGL